MFYAIVVIKFISVDLGVAFCSFSLSGIVSLNHNTREKLHLQQCREAKVYLLESLVRPWVGVCLDFFVKGWPNSEFLKIGQSQLLPYSPMST